MHHTYILRCSDNTLYVGSTNDLEQRVHNHNHAKSGAHYTKIRRPVFLVYSEAHRTLAKVRAREAALKRLTRAEKLDIIKACQIIPKKIPQKRKLQVARVA